jgi:Rab-GTPase-TBC domain
VQALPAHVSDGILFDVPKSFPEYSALACPQGHWQLTTVLSAYAALDPDVGYRPNMNFLAGALLLYSPGVDEALAALRHLMMRHDMRQLYLPGSEALEVRLIVTVIVVGQVAWHVPCVCDLQLAGTSLPRPTLTCWACGGVQRNSAGCVRIARRDFTHGTQINQIPPRLVNELASSRFE